MSLTIINQLLRILVYEAVLLIMTNVAIAAQPGHDRLRQGRCTPLPWNAAALATQANQEATPILNLQLNTLPSTKMLCLSLPEASDQGPVWTTANIVGAYNGDAPASGLFPNLDAQFRVGLLALAPGESQNFQPLHLTCPKCFHFYFLWKYYTTLRNLVR